MTNRQCLSLAVLIVALTLLIAWPQNSAAQDVTRDFYGEIKDADHPPGYRDYIEMGCWQCHGFQGQGGEGSDGPRLAPDPMPFEAFLNLVRRPANVMPAYSPRVISDVRLRRIYGYLQSIPPVPAVSDIPLLSQEQ